jgi:hypothetical protein
VYPKQVKPARARAQVDGSGTAAAVTVINPDIAYTGYEVERGSFPIAAHPLASAPARPTKGYNVFDTVLKVKESKSNS